jgi:hypothetical protein
MAIGKMDMDIGHHALAKSLLDQYGPLMAGEQLVRALGFTSAAAMRQAKRRGLTGVRIFNMPNRRGVFALTTDVANWIATNHLKSGENDMGP